MNKLRPMRFKDLEVTIRSYNHQYFEDLRLEFNQYNIFEHYPSFNIKKNYNQIMHASKLIIQKPERIEMKFETYDHKFQITIIEKRHFKKLLVFTMRYAEFKRNLISRMSDSNMALYQDQNTFIFEPYGFYRLHYRWMPSLKMIIFNQANHFQFLDVKNVLFRFEIRNAFSKIGQKKCNLRKLQAALDSLKNGEKPKGFGPNKTLSEKELTLLTTRTDILNFSIETSKVIRKRLSNDLQFITKQGITNYSLQFVIEKVVSRDSDIGPNSFLSEDEKYIYHFGIGDFTEIFE